METSARAGREAHSKHRESLLLQAEMATISLTSSTGAKDGSDVKVKQLQTPSTQPSAVGAKPCKFWATSSGCSPGARCKFGHSWEGLEDKTSRCWECSSLEHRKNVCPALVDKADKGRGDGKKENLKENPKGKSKGNGGKGKPQINKTDGTAGAASSETPAAIAKVNREAEGVLLDPGATHILRALRSEEEWMGAHETIVHTATGECVLKQTESGALLSKDEAAPIIPLGEVVRQGGTIDWKPGQRRLRHPHAGILNVNVVANCPYISLEDGEKLMACLEGKSLQVRSVLKALATGEEEHGHEWLIDPKVLKNKFRLAPLKHIAKLTMRKKVGSAALPWNRRMRRTAEQFSIFCRSKSVMVGGQTAKGLGDPVSGHASAPGHP